MRTTLLTDDQVLEARALHEFDGWPERDITKAFSLSPTYTRQLLTYLVRSKLIPKRNQPRRKSHNRDRTAKNGTVDDKQ